VSAVAGPAVTQPSLSRGIAFGDFDNDGNVDVVINNMNGPPTLLRCDRFNGNHWITLKLVGVQSNRSAIGARLRCTTRGHSQLEEVRSGSSYLSQGDLRVHFGLGSETKVDRLEIYWPSGQIDVLKNMPVDRIVTIREGELAGIPAPPSRAREGVR
jgi:enediyne biosynthesis protein E4